MSYEIIVSGDAGPTLLAALPDFHIAPGREGVVRLVGPVEDQAALQGLLHRLHALHADLVEVRRVTE